MRDREALRGSMRSTWCARRTRGTRGTMSSTSSSSSSSCSHSLRFPRARAGVGAGAGVERVREACDKGGKGKGKGKGRERRRSSSSGASIASIASIGRIIGRTRMRSRPLESTLRDDNTNVEEDEWQEDEQDVQVEVEVEDTEEDLEVLEASVASFSDTHTDTDAKANANEKEKEIEKVEVKGSGGEAEAEEGGVTDSMDDDEEEGEVFMESEDTKMDYEYDNEDDDELAASLFDPTDWRSLQMLAESGVADEQIPGTKASEYAQDERDFARDALLETHDAFLAKTFFEEASEQYFSSHQQQAEISIFGTSTRRKKRGSKNKSVGAQAQDADGVEDMQQQDSDQVAQQVHPSRVTGTSEWYPETSERCLFYHERLRDCALEAEGDQAIVILEEMRMAGILPGPKAYHAAIHAYTTEGDLVAAVNVMRKAFEMMVPPPLESSILITRMIMKSEDFSCPFETLLPAWNWYGYDTNRIANAAMIALLEVDVDEVLQMLEERSEGAVQWNVDADLLHGIVASLCKSERDKRAVDLLEHDLNVKELGLLTQDHLNPLVHFPIQRGELGLALYQLKVVLISIANPYLDFKKGLIGLFNMVLKAYLEEDEGKEFGSELYEKWSSLDRLREQHCVVRDGHWYRLSLEILLSSSLEDERHTYTVLEHMDGIYQSDRVHSMERGLVRSGDQVTVPTIQNSLFQLEDSHLLERLSLFFSKHGVPASLLYTMHIACKCGLESQVARAIDDDIDTNGSKLSVSTKWLSAWRDRYEPEASPSREARNVALQMLKADAATPRNVSVDEKGRVVEVASDDEEEDKPLPVWEMSQVQLMAECLARGLDVSRYSLASDLCMRVHTARCFDPQEQAPPPSASPWEMDDGASPGEGDGGQVGDASGEGEDTQGGEEEIEESEEMKIVEALLRDQMTIDNDADDFQEAEHFAQESVEDIIGLQDGIGPLQTPAALALKIARSCVSLGCTEAPTREDLQQIQEMCSIYSDESTSKELADLFGNEL